MQEPAPELSPKSTETSLASSQDVRLQAMIAEAHQMLRDLQSNAQASTGNQASSSSAGDKPTVATLLAMEGLPTMQEIKEREALLDTGALHALRPAMRSFAGE